jgi:hypothetical protein
MNNEKKELSNKLIDYNEKVFVDKMCMLSSFFLHK